LNLDSSGDISGAMFFGDSDGFDPRVGTDTVNFDGDFTIDGSQFSEFENAVLLSGTHSGTGLDTFTQLFTVSAGATFNAGGATVTNLTSNGTTKVGSGETFNVTGDLNVAGAGILDIGIASASNFANFIVGGDAIIDSSGNLMISVDDTNSLVVTDTFSPLTANSITVGGATTGDSFTIKDNFLAFNFSGVVEAANSGQVLNVSLEEGFGQLIEEVSGGTAGELTKIVEFLDSTPATIEQQAVSDAIQEVLVTFDDTEIAELETFIEEISTAPGASSPSTNAGTSTVQSAGSLIQARVEQRVAAASPTTSQSSTTDFANNYAAAEEPQDSVFTQILVTENGYGFETNVANAFGGEWWVQSFGGVQSTKDDATNVSASNGGLSIGYDAFLESGALAGVGGVYTTAYSKTKVTGGSTTTARSNTFGALGYFGNTFDNGLGISTSLGYFLSDTDQKRFDSLNDTYNADQKSYTAYGSVNVSYAIDAANFVFTPNAGLTYTNVRQGGYTETSSTGGALSQTVSASTLNSLIGTFGGSLSKTERVNGINISAEIHAAALYELNDTLGSYSLSLGNGAISFASQNISALDRLRGNIGGSLRFGISDTLTTQIGYDAVIGEKTQEHNVRFRIGKKF
jgi:outer membrane autotransporter protein